MGSAAEHFACLTSFVIRFIDCIERLQKAVYKDLILQIIWLHRCNISEEFWGTCRSLLQPLGFFWGHTSFVCGLLMQSCCYFRYPPPTSTTSIRLDCLLHSELHTHISEGLKRWNTSWFHWFMKSKCSLLLMKVGRVDSLSIGTLFSSSCINTSCILLQTCSSVTNDI